MEEQGRIEREELGWSVEDVQAAELANGSPQIFYSLLVYSLLR